jgi:hypothetical protein
MHRTQVYLTKDQVRHLKRSAKSHKVSMAELIRNAIDDFIRRDARTDPTSALERTFGALPKMEVPSRDEWDRGVG